MVQENSAVLENVRPPKRQYTKREHHPPTIAEFNQLIEVKQQSIETLQAEIESLIARRNALCLDEFTKMGLLDLVSDPEMVKLLALKVEEISGKQK